MNCPHCPHCRHQAQARPEEIAAEVDLIKSSGYGQRVTWDGFVYRDVAALLVERSEGTLYNGDWQERLPVRKHGRNGRAMYALEDIARVRIEERKF